MVVHDIHLLDFQLLVIVGKANFDTSLTLSLWCPDLKMTVTSVKFHKIVTV